MKLGEALSLRARHAQSMNDLRERITKNALVQEGEAPAENALDLLAEFSQVSAEHSILLARIGRTNASTLYLATGSTLADALHTREDLRRTRGVYEAAAKAATPGNTPRYMRSELKYVAQLDVPDLRKQIEKFDKQIREIDARVQEINWKTDLLP